ncbi:type VI secretion system Vgr family protein [Mucilaginibacter glaciei]|uniref:Type IV secretion protein Rhs n=1 Tax=Mucilaginibacter glaciei TaxID=2772109 RepID=A0A926NND3_9SPHI|nr:phage baseplate assembly protein V [Mucilaginibacter glaciei]MBD1391655.1 type IV secretion protein Rhs [Mucilaginibacter glaciei]
MDSKIKVDISIEGTPIAHFSSFTLDQRFNEHHTFQLRFNHDQIENTNKVTLEKSKEFIGKNLTVQFGRIEDAEHQFTGKITRVEISQSHGFQGDIVISGFSPSILIDRGADLGSYLNKDLKTILQQATADAPQNDLSFNIAPAYTSPIDYLIQYRESDFEFINRLSAEYHEWFYYDGTKLNFGKPTKLEEITLIYGRDLHSIQYGMQISPLSYQKFSYNSVQDQLLTAKPSGASNGSADMSHAISASNQVYSKQYNEPLDVRVNSQKDIDTFVNDEHKAIVSELLSIMGNGDNPQVALGKVVNISTSMRGQIGFEVQDFGKFLVTAVYHQLDGVGHYQNTFEGVSADSEKLLVKNAEKPTADMQLAIVTDNDDPKKQGRIKVQFKWECTNNDVTEWLRVVTPDAGSSDKVNQNRGFVFVPEIGDQVLVAFEEGNIARPVIIGSMFSGKTGIGGGGGNNSKSISSKSGHTLHLNDAAGITFIDKSKLNHIEIDGQSQITVTADKVIKLVSGGPNGSSITLNADGTIDIIGKIINIQGTEAINANAENKTGKNVNIGKSAETKVDVKGSSITSVSNQTHTIQGKEVVIN